MRALVAGALVLGSTTLALLLGELLLRSLLNPGDYLLATLVKDPALGHRLQPGTAGHDALGFRNAALPERARAVAIGDSQTYGVSATRDGSWPHQLGALMGETVYSMALGGYGPLEYLHLSLQDARKFRPQVLLVGFYFGNDLIDACRSAQEGPYWRDWRQSVLDGGCYGAVSQSSPGARPKRLAAVRDWLSGHSMVYSVSRTALAGLLAGVWRGSETQAASAEQRMSWTDAARVAVGTVFTPQFRLSLLDPSLPAVQEGMRVTRKAFLRLKESSDAGGFRLLVVLIPTKERAYCSYLVESGVRMPAAFVALCGAEARVNAELKEYLAQMEIAYVDVVPAMEDQIRQHVQIYPPSDDGHPRAAGYAAIARAVHHALQLAPGQASIARP